MCRSLVASKWANRHTWSNISQCNVSGTERAPKSTTKVWGFWLNRRWKSVPELLWQQPCEPYWTVWGYINHVFWVFTRCDDSSRVCAPHAIMTALLKCPLASPNSFCASSSQLHHQLSICWLKPTATNLGSSKFSNPICGSEDHEDSIQSSVFKSMVIKWDNCPCKISFQRIGGSYRIW